MKTNPVTFINPDIKVKVVIVEDQFIEANNLRKVLRKAGYSVCSIATSVDGALEIIEAETPDLVLVDIYLKGDQTGIDLAKILKRKKIAFVYLSANSDKSVFNAAKLTGPYGFLVKPFREKDVLAMLDIAWYHHQQNLELLSRNVGVGPIDPGLTNRADLTDIIGKSDPLLETIRNAGIVGPTETAVLILGENGTGKELIAQYIHRISLRQNEALTIVNCATLPANLVESELFGHERPVFTGAIEKRIGKFEQADNGTIFLDEIGELSLDLQVKFLRVLQGMEVEPIGGRRKKINVRVIAATNRNLEEEVAAGRFRMDLYYRLNVFPIHLPALRERTSDIPLLAEHFVKYYAARQKKQVTGLSNDVIKSLMNYSWPGNVRELENLIARGVLLASSPRITSLPLPVTNAKAAPELGPMKTISQNERDHILTALAKCNWKIFGRGGAAELLDINGSTLKSRMKKLGIGKHFM
jgi:two-component system, NtrC family, response regulator HydG